MKNWITYLEITAIIASAFFPLLFNLPYRVNIFLSWEGAYRLYLGQIPYVDFGLPLGFGYWIIPAIFFKIFGPYLFSLVKAQVFINILSLIAFRNILKLLNVADAKRLFSVLILIVSYSFPSFWPWYNHSVFVFQLISFNLILLAIYSKHNRLKPFYVILGGLFAFLSFYTKQDSGSLAIVFGAVILLFHSISKKKFKPLGLYIIAVILFGAVFILPFLDNGFLYWFNMGQPPHDSRLSFFSFANKFFAESVWAKFYIFLIVVVVWNKFDSRRILQDEKFYTFFLIAVGTILQAIIIRVTSPLTPDEQNYFHAFAFAFLISNVDLKINLKKASNLIVFVTFIILWWSPLFWDYTTRLLNISPPQSKGDSQVNFSKIQSKWVTSNLKAFEHILMPEETIKGIKDILNLEIVKRKDNLQVLNMSELTPLAYEIGYEPLKNQPLWFHLNVGMFQKEVDFFKKNIKNQEYDLVLFQSIPGLDNFFPYEVQKQLEKNYRLIDTFEAPRKRSEGYSYIEVYIKPNNH